MSKLREWKLVCSTRQANGQPIACVGIAAIAQRAIDLSSR